MNNLKPCPFCGGQAKSITTIANPPYHYGGHRITCTECKAQSAFFYNIEYTSEREGNESFKKAVCAWNRRTDDSQLQIIQPNMKDTQINQV